MNEEWLSAHLDGELSADERLELDAALSQDPALASTYAELARVRAMLRGEPVDMPGGALGRMIAHVETADGSGTHRVDSTTPAEVVSLARHRRVPTFAAAAAAMVIIASVVGGLGGSRSFPALGDLVARHEAAAAVVEGAPMPDDMDHMDPMPMDDANAVALAMPSDYSMQHAFADEETVHLVYRSGAGDAVSVFRHEGDVDVGAFGAGSRISGDEADMWTGPMDGAFVAVVDGRGYVWVVVSAEPHDDMVGDMMHDLPTRTPSLDERLRDVADAAVEPFRIWD